MGAKPSVDQVQYAKYGTQYEADVLAAIKEGIRHQPELGQGLLVGAGVVQSQGWKITSRGPTQSDLLDLAAQALDEVHQSAGRLIMAGTEILTQGMAALADLHTLGFAHGDVKPENAVLLNDGRVCLIDFGLSARLTPEGLQAWSEQFGDEWLTPLCTHPDRILETRFTGPDRVMGSLQRPPSVADDNFRAVCSFHRVISRLLPPWRPTDIGSRLYGGHADPLGALGQLDSGRASLGSHRTGPQLAMEVARLYSRRQKYQQVEQELAQLIQAQPDVRASVEVAVRVGRMYIECMAIADFFDTAATSPGLSEQIREPLLALFWLAGTGGPRARLRVRQE